MNKKKILILVCTIVMLLVLLICFWEPISRIFKEKESLNYQNVEHFNILFINILDSNDLFSVDIDNEEAVGKLTDYINSLELIQVKRPKEEYDENAECFTLYISGEQSDAISFYRGYLSIHINDTADSVYTEYYIVDSGYNSKDGSSKMLKFLEELINKYAEE